MLQHAKTSMPLLGVFGVQGRVRASWRALRQGLLAPLECLTARLLPAIGPKSQSNIIGISLQVVLSSRCMGTSADRVESLTAQVRAH